MRSSVTVRTLKLRPIEFLNTAEIVFVLRGHLSPDVLFLLVNPNRTIHTPRTPRRPAPWVRVSSEPVLFSVSTPRRVDLRRLRDYNPFERVPLSSLSCHYSFCCPGTHRDKFPVSFHLLDLSLCFSLSSHLVFCRDFPFLSFLPHTSVDKKLRGSNFVSLTLYLLIRKPKSPILH